MPYAKQQNGLQFFFKFVKHPCPRDCVNGQIPYSRDILSRQISPPRPASPPPLPTDIDRCITCQESSSMRIQYKDDEQTFVTMTCDDRRLRRCTSLCTGCPKKSGVLVWNFNFETNIVAKLLHLCSFESLFIQLCYGG